LFFSRLQCPKGRLVLGLKFWVFQKGLGDMFVYGWI
jgi:hypothetical protein